MAKGHKRTIASCKGLTNKSKPKMGAKRCRPKPTPKKAVR